MPLLGRSTSTAFTLVACFPFLVVLGGAGMVGLVPRRAASPTPRDAAESLPM